MYFVAHCVIGANSGLGDRPTKSLGLVSASYKVRRLRRRMLVKRLQVNSLLNVVIDASLLPGRPQLLQRPRISYGLVFPVCGHIGEL